MDKDLEKTVKAVIFVAVAISALSAWMLFVEKPTKGTFKRAVRRSWPLL